MKTNKQAFVSRKVADIMNLYKEDVTILVHALYFDHKESYADIAKRLGISRQNVQQTYFYNNPKINTQ